MSVLNNLGERGIFPPRLSVTAVGHISYDLCVTVPRTFPNLKVILDLQYDVSAAVLLANEITTLLFALVLVLCLIEHTTVSSCGGKQNLPSRPMVH